MNLPLLALVASLLAPASQPVASSAESPTVVCFGDSITKAGYPEQLAQQLKVTVHNSGIGGNTSAQGVARLKRDVLDYHPKVVVILFGTNDSRVDAPKVNVPPEKYEANLKKMVDASREIGAKVAICTMPPINATPYFQRHEKAAFEAAGGFEVVLERYRAIAKKVAEEKKVPLIDLNVELAKQPTWQSADGVHPTKEGNVIISKIIADAIKPLLPAP